MSTNSRIWAMPPEISREAARKAAEHARHKKRDREALADAEREHEANPSRQSEQRLRIARASGDNEEVRRRLDLRTEVDELHRYATERLEGAVLGARSARVAINLDSQQRSQQVREKVKDAAEWNRVLRDLPSLSEVAIVKSEPLTYRKDNAREFSYFRDLIQRDESSAEGQEAHARLERHGREVRVNPSRVDGQGGFFSPPAWIISEWSSVPRAGRVLSRLTGSMPLSRGASSVNIPRITTGNQVGVTADGAATPSRDITDVGLSSPAMPISGHSDVGLQMLDQSPHDEASFDLVTFRDLEAAYAEALEAFMLAGSGQNGQIAGLTIVNDTANDVTYADGTPTAAEMVPFLTKAAGRVGRNRRQPMEAWLLTSARWAWLSAAGLPASTLSIDVQVDDGRVGTLLGWPAYPDDAIPETLGASSTEDLIIATRPSDLRLWETEPRFLIDRESLSGTLSARLTLTRTAAFIADRFPTSTAVVSGTGMIFPAGDK